MKTILLFIIFLLVAASIPSAVVAQCTNVACGKTTTTNSGMWVCYNSFAVDGDTSNAFLATNGSNLQIDLGTTYPVVGVRVLVATSANNGGTVCAASSATGNFQVGYSVTGWPWTWFTTVSSSISDNLWVNLPVTQANVQYVQINFGATVAVREVEVTTAYQVTNATISPNAVDTSSGTYTISVSGKQVGGSQANISNLAGIINFQQTNGNNQPAANYRGLFAWSRDNFSMWGSYIDMITRRDCAGGTFAAKYLPPSGETYGASYINLLGCSYTTTADSVTANFTVSFNPFSSPATNVVSGWLANTGRTVIDGWRPFSTFTLLSAPTFIGTSKADVGTATYKISILNPTSSYISIDGTAKNWKAKTDATGLGTKYGYGYWNTMLANKATALTYSDAVDSLNTLANAGAAGTKIYKSGSMTINSTQRFSSARSLIILVDGNLNIGSGANFSLLRTDKSTFLAFIVKGNIVVDANVAGVGGTPGLDGVFITDGFLNINGGSSQLLANGIYFSKNGVSNSRSLSNNASPAVIYQFDPSLVLNAPIELMKPKFSWKEIAP